MKKSMILYGWTKKSIKLENQRGSILVTVLAVLAILLTIFLFAMTYSLSRFGYHKKMLNKTTATYLSEAGINRKLHEINKGVYFNAPKTFTSPNGGRITVSTLAWGPYLLINSDGAFANQTIRTKALVGSASSSFFSAAITVCEEKYPFVVAGKTKIYGDVNTGTLGLAVGRIKGESVISEDFHRGDNNIHKTLDVPKLDTIILNRYMNEMRTRKLNTETVFQGSKLLGKKNKVLFENQHSIYIENNLEINDFTFLSAKDITSIFVNGFVEIRNKTRISGLVEIVADGPIYVKDSSILDNVILYTEDSIIFSHNSTFSGIAISDKKISVKDRSTLIYPSMLLLIAKSVKCESDCGIYLTSSNKLESICFLSFDNIEINKKDYILYLDTLTSFTGVLVSEGISDLRGYVNGTIITGQFKYYQPPTTYVNWVKDFYINRDGLDYFPALPVLEENSSSGKFKILRKDKNIL